MPTKTAFAGEKGTWHDRITALAQRLEEMQQGNEACVPDLANHLAERGREDMKNVNCWTDAVYQPPIPITIFRKSILPFLK